MGQNEAIAHDTGSSLRGWAVAFAVFVFLAWFMPEYTVAAAIACAAAAAWWLPKSQTSEASKVGKAEDLMLSLF